ncbi:MAG: low molecular weight phosphotyrosine protein phosphatase [Actinomycetaceae bacterium]|nr:low molecular weight phosphotyrosine protein phosphatase [Actinomycetaceae bacterium]
MSNENPSRRCEERSDEAISNIRAHLARKPQILVVCTGNICRSPMGEVVLRERLAEAGLDERYSVASCGVSAEEQGNPIYPPAARVLREAGYDVPARRAHRASDAELRESGLILAMTVGHARSLRRRMSELGLDLSVLHLWREFDDSGLEIALGGCFGEGGFLAESASEGRSKRGSYQDFYVSNGKADVPDPWYGDDAGYWDTLACVEAGADGIIDVLSQ